MGKLNNWCIISEINDTVLNYSTTVGHFYSISLYIPSYFDSLIRF